LPYVKDGVVVATTVVILAAMWPPLLAKKIGSLD
jgi:hypothetical protein